MNKFTQALLGLALVASSVAPASAGEKFGSLVHLDTTNRIAYGAQGSARNSTDANQWMDVVVVGFSTGGAIAIFEAMDATGHYVNCNSSQADVLAAARSVNSDSYIWFSWNTDGTCNAAQIETGSFYEPKK